MQVSFKFLNKAEEAAAEFILKTVASLAEDQRNNDPLIASLAIAFCYFFHGREIAASEYLCRIEHDPPADMGALESLRTLHTACHDLERNQLYTCAPSSDARSPETKP